MKTTYIAIAAVTIGQFVLPQLRTVQGTAALIFLAGYISGDLTRPPPPAHEQDDVAAIVHDLRRTQNGVIEQTAVKVAA